MATGSWKSPESSAPTSESPHSHLPSKDPLASQVAAGEQKSETGNSSKSSPASYSESGTGNYRKRLTGGVGSKFIKAKTQQDFHWGQDDTTADKVRAYLLWFLRSDLYSNFMAFVAVFDTYATCADIDARASNTSPPTALMWLVQLCLGLYTAELVLVVMLKGFRVFRNWLVVLDAAIVVCGIAEAVVNTFVQEVKLEDKGVRVLRVLRLSRMFRLIRLLRKMRELRELQKFVTMMSTCLKTLAWSFLFCFVMMTIWAMLLVEMVHPLIVAMHQETTVFSDCGEQCLRATSSIMHANLFLYQTVIAGDSWGLIAVPVIEEHPATATIFIGSSITLVFGVLNLIVAVVVDSFADARERDVLNLAEEMERDHENDQKFLQKVFERIDEDGSGELTLEELVEGARNDPEFQSRLRVMDIDEADLQQLFEMIDSNGSGAIEAAEFIAPLSRWVRDSKTATRFIKYNMMRTLEVQDELCRQSHNQFLFLKNELALLQNSIQSAPKEPLLLPDLSDSSESGHLAGTSSMATEPLEFCERAEFRLSHIAEEQELEQPRPSPQSTLKEKPPPVSREPPLDFPAMDSTLEKLEERLLVAAEGALRRSMGYFEYALQQHLDKMTAASLGPPSISIGLSRATAKYRGMDPPGSRRPSGDYRHANFNEGGRHPSADYRHANFSEGSRRPSADYRHANFSELSQPPWGRWRPRLPSESDANAADTPRPGTSSRTICTDFSAFPGTRIASASID